MRLHEQGCLRRVDSRGQQPDRHVAGPLREGVLVVLAGNGVQVHDADQRLVAALQVDPVLHRAEPVADVQLAGRLNSREYAWHDGQLTLPQVGTQDRVRLRLTASGPSRRGAAAGDYLRSVRRPADPSGWTLKGSRDFVTEVDRTAERDHCRSILLAAEPGSRMVGEELAPDLVTEGLVWIVDPLDGTTNFLHGFPSYAVSIAAALDGVLQAGVVLHVPRQRDLLRLPRWRRLAGGAAPRRSRPSPIRSSP